ncbi:MAG TPA: glycosyltransferase family 1 protein [Chryseolinea sp.]
MQVILIGNYPRDKQESMERFAQMVSEGFRNVGVQTAIWRPLVYLGAFFQTTSGLGKWIGYIDKWVIFPAILWWRLRKKKFNNPDVRFIVCDHSNAPYLKYLPKERSSITCHDALAIRGAFGYADAYCPASPAGVILQKWILRSLQNAGTLIATTQLTIDHLTSLSSGKVLKQKNWHIIPLAFNADFRRIDKGEKDRLLASVGLNSNSPFLLHVGSALPRKNRKLLIGMIAAIGDKWNGRVCFAGEALEEELLNYAKSLGVADRVFSIVKPSHEILRALYNGCEAFVFPSFSEGFGWPPIEAQACGAPVIASNIPPMPEVSGVGALFADPNKPEDFADAFLTLNADSSLRNGLIQKGLKNIERFHIDKMMSAYLKLQGINKTNV